MARGPTCACGAQNHSFHSPPGVQHACYAADGRVEGEKLPGFHYVTMMLQQQTLGLPTPLTSCCMG